MTTMAVSCGKRTITNFRCADNIDVLAGNENEETDLVNHFSETFSIFGFVGGITIASAWQQNLCLFIDYYRTTPVVTQNLT
jgi:hypothetical protein